MWNTDQPRLDHADDGGVLWVEDFVSFPMHEAEWRGGDFLMEGGDE